MLASEAVRDRLTQWWGSDILDRDGRVDRSKVARIVFRDPAQLKRLEDLLYPQLAILRDESLERYEHDPQIRATVMDSPKLLEAGLEGLCDAIIMIDAPPAIRLERLKAARQWTAEDLKQREAQQAALDEKRARADDVIINDGDLERFKQTVEHVFERIMRAFHSRRPTDGPSAGTIG